MNARASTRCLFACATALAVSGAAPAQTVDGGQAAFGQAMVDYERQHFAVAFDALARLADAGHPEAARVVLLMHAQGPRLYGQRFEVETARRTAWLDAASTRASPKLAARWGALLRAEAAAPGPSPPLAD